MIARKTPFETREQARKELQDLSLKFHEARKGKDVELDKREWEVLRWVCKTYGKDEAKQYFGVDFDELYEEVEK